MATEIDLADIDLQDALQEHFGFSEFLQGQEETIRSALKGRDMVVVMPTGSGKSLCYQLSSLVLPGTTLAVVMAVHAVRMLRDNLIEVLESSYVRMAELKGLPRRLVLMRHALPNALIPTLNVTALNLGYLIGGVVIVEKVFSFPGFGGLLIDSLQLRDAPLIEATVLIAAAVYIAANLLADLGAILLNPRLRRG